MSATKPISPGDWVFWYSGLWKVLTIGDECVPKQYMQGRMGVRPHGFQVATLEPLNVPDYVLRWYNTEVKYHGGVTTNLKRVNPLSAEKRGYLKRPTK